MFQQVILYILGCVLCVVLLLRSGIVTVTFDDTERIPFRNITKIVYSETAMTIKTNKGKVVTYKTPEKRYICRGDNCPDNVYFIVCEQFDRDKWSCALDGTEMSVHYSFDCVCPTSTNGCGAHVPIDPSRCMLTYWLDHSS